MLPISRYQTCVTYLTLEAVLYVQTGTGSARSKSYMIMSSAGLLQLIVHLLDPGPMMVGRPHTAPCDHVISANVWRVTKWSSQMWRQTDVCADDYSSRMFETTAAIALLRHLLHILIMVQQAQPIHTANVM